MSLPISYEIGGIIKRRMSTKFDLKFTLVAISVL